ncbi:MAG: DNA helicase [Actinomycetales bacterium]|nr:DNA helicase [Actinomycetales bacterium]
MSAKVAEAIAGWARELSEVGGPNTLLWATEGAERQGYLDLTTSHPSGVSMLLAGRPTSLSDLLREAGTFEKARETARRIHAKAHELLEERGIVAGFVAIGIATWDPPRAHAVVEAPVLLRACTLRPTSPALHDFDLDLGAAVEVNPALINYLQSVAGLAVDPVALAALTDVRASAGGFDPYPAYAALGRLCADLPGFAVSPRLILGTYPYGKPDMVADVSGQGAWLAQVDLVAALAGDGDATTRLRQELPEPTENPDPQREVRPFDLDATQESVVEAVRAGRQLVLTAPAGTGSTQTVAAIVAALAHDGKRVLYVTARRESLHELTRRLADVGLGDLVLDLTGAAEDRRHVPAVLGAALTRVAALDDIALADAADPRGRLDRAARIAADEQALADHVAALHEVRHPWGVTAYEIQHAMAELAARRPAPASRVRIAPGALAELDRARVRELADNLQSAAAAGAWSAEGGDPWFGAEIRSAADVDRARGIVEGLTGGGLAATTADLDGILRESTLPPARAARDWGHALTTMRGVRVTLEVFRPEVFDIPLDEHVVATGNAAYRASSAVELGRLSRSRVRRQARRMLRPGRPPADLHAELVRARSQRQAWHDLVGAGGRPEISPRLEEGEAAYAALSADLEWLDARLRVEDDTPTLLAASFPLLRNRLRVLAARLDRLDVLPQVTAVVDELRAVGMGEVLDDFAERGVAAEAVPGELDHIWWASLGQYVRDRDPRYAGHDGAALREAAERVDELDATGRTVDAARVRAVVDRRARARAREHPRQTDLVHAQAGARQGQLPFRDLYREADQVVGALRPCLAVSPYAVAQVLAPGTTVDVVILDDAGCITVAESVSAISRARRAVIVARPDGPGPTPFRVDPVAAGVVAAAPGNEGDPTESSLGHSVYAAAAAVLPNRSLTWWHATIDARIPLAPPSGLSHGVPSPRRQPAVRFEHVDGTAKMAPADDAAIEWTEAEVSRVVDLVLEHAQRTPSRSLAVLTLTDAAAERVRDGVRDAVGRLDGDPAQGFFAAEDSAGDGKAAQGPRGDGGRGEPFVVASMGETRSVLRDVVVLAVGYGRTPHGRVLHRFPTLSSSAGERALVAATSSARQELIVVSTLRSDDLDLTRLKGTPARSLVDLLVHAERGGIRESESSAAGAGDPCLPTLRRVFARKG